MSTPSDLIFSFDTNRYHQLDVQELFRKGLSRHQEGHLSDAEKCYRSVLTIQPNHAGANHYLGVVALARKNLPEAMRYMSLALQLDRDNPVFLNNYGAALRETKKYDNAFAVFQKAVELKPDYADAWSNLGQAQIDRGELPQAEGKCSMNRIVA